MALQYGLLRRGPMTMAPSQMGGFAKSSAEYETPNVEFHVQPLQPRQVRRAVASLSGHHRERPAI